MQREQRARAAVVDTGLALYCRQVRSDVFRADMVQAVPLDELFAMSEPHYPMVHYLGLTNRVVQVVRLFALANLWMVRRTPLATTG